MDIKARLINNFNSMFKKNNSNPQSVWGGYSNQAFNTTSWFDFSEEDFNKNKEIIGNNRGPTEIKRVTWFIPEFDNAFWGGIHTILRFAAYMKEMKGVKNRFILIGSISKDKIRKSMSEAFPSLRDEEICILASEKELSTLEETDATICTLWTTAYFSLKFNKTKRKFYFIQDYEPLFYPAGSTSAQADETYRFGFNGICNTVSLKNIYESQYGGIGEFFTPCVDTNIFYPNNNDKSKRPYTVFFYGRPGHPRNGFELGIAALKKMKNRMKDQVRILTAGANWEPSEYGLEGIVENLGILSYVETAELYRKCDAALIMMFTRHPSYIPFELMASKCLVVTNYNPANIWLLHDGENCLLAHASASALSELMEKGLKDQDLRNRITDNALNQIAKNYSNWDGEMEKIFSYINRTQEAELNKRNLAYGKEGGNMFDLVTESQSRIKNKKDMENLTFGGERVSHLYPNDCYYAHLSIYNFALDLIKNKVVLDAGSGGGYGSVYLADNGASSVLGIDISDDAIEYSQEYFKRSNLNYHKMDLQKIAGLKPRSFDLIFSSNALEHVPDVTAFFRSAWELLKEDGTLVVAVPPVTNKESRQGNLINPYHLNIWSPRQWYYVLNQYFEDIQCYRHSFDKPNIKLNFANTPEQTIVTEKDFLFEQIQIDQFFNMHTLTVIFVVKKPRPISELPDIKEQLKFVDDSFTRPLQV